MWTSPIEGTGGFAGPCGRTRGLRTSEQLGERMNEGITGRALLAGTLIAGVIGAQAAYENLVISASPMNTDYSMGAAVFYGALLVLLVNPALRLANQTWSFSRSELATLYIMAMVACVLPTTGLVGHLLPAISGGIYYATRENNWLETIIPHIEPWMLVANPEGIKGFYEGLSRGESTPWGIWLRPLLHWSVLLAGFFGTVIALMVLLRRQWVVNERLLYPLLQVPIAMIGEEGQERGAFPSLFRQRLFWMGVLIPLLMYSLKALHRYDPIIPIGFPTFIQVNFANGAVGIPFGVNYAGIGFGYLLSTKISFSVWFMGVLTVIEEVVFMRLGFFSSERLQIHTNPSVYPAYQGVGALVVFSIFVVWMARSHLRQVFHTAWRAGRTGGGDDRDEILSYRATCLLLAGSLILMWGWLVMAGLAWWLGLVFLPLLFLMMVGLTRIVVEGGLAVTRMPMIPCDLVAGALGGRTLGATNLGVVGMTFPWTGELRVSVMSALAHGLKLAQIHVPGQRRRLLAGVVLAIILSVGCATFVMLLLGYRYGAINLSPHWFFGTVSGGRVFSFIAQHLAEDSGPRWGSLGFAGIGAAIQLLVMLAHQRLAWWPIHPLAFPIGAVWCTHQVMASMFIAWVAKLTTLHYGGVRFYSTLKPLFMGMILGQYFTGGLWMIIDWFTGKQANYLFFW